MAEVQLNFGAGLVKINHSGPLEEIIRFISSNGYEAKTTGPGKNVTQSTSNNLRLKQALTVLSGVFAGAGMVTEWAGNDERAAVLLFIAAMVTGGFYVYKSAVSSLKSLVLDMNVLMTVSSIGAVFIGEWSEAATVVFLFSVGNMLQAYTIDRTRDSIKKMIRLAPREARRLLPGGTEETVPVDEINTGDHILVRPGENIAVDGIVISGISWADQASITGESKPVEKREGDRVFAGSINNEGSLEVKCSHPASDSTLAKMIEMVEEAQAKKAPSQQFVDVFARYYTPAVIFGAAAVVLIPVAVFDRAFADWFYKALVLLVISCPCALVISTPVSIVSAIGNAARNGVLVKGGVYLEALGKVKNIAFDKTGTVTSGRMSVTDIFPADGITEEDLLELAGAVERFSEHPVAKAVMAETDNRNLASPYEGTFRSYPGRGASLETGDGVIYAGNKRFMKETGIDTGHTAGREEILESEGKSAVYIARDYRLLGVLAVADTPRSGAGEALNQLRNQGIDRLVMLSGDNEKIVGNIAGRLGIKHYKSNLLPGDKVREVEQMAEDGVTVMVGDGVNDAPALAVATVGIAMGAAGTDTALETADIALMNDELKNIPAVVMLGKRTRAVIRQNIALAVLLKLLFLVLTFAGISNLWMAVFADTGASVMVTLNGMRLARFRFPDRPVI
ncbi:MAG: heavy metal translocating P-type ATPase [Firmicutes bacterium HGW-Firmicutes-14]|nr:MAG: heavy metal translocating P-type ATPase [Firmicutes bacterium HGW-Firmicutes-14]